MGQSPLQQAIAQGHQQLIDAIEAMSLPSQVFEPDTPMLRQGQSIDPLYWIDQGEFTLHYAAKNGKEFGIGIWRVEKRLFGEIELLTGECCQFDVVPLEPVTVRKLPRAQFEKLLLSEPNIALWLSNQMACHYQQQMHSAIRRSLYPLAHNIAEDLLKREQQGLADMKGYQEAARFGCGQRVYRRVIAQLIRQGLIEKREGQLAITDRQRLTEFLEETANPL